MSDTPNRQAVIVGLFVSIGIAILAGGVLTIGGLNELFAKNIRISTTFDDVGGLKTGDAVWFSGVPVGTVKAVGFAGGRQVEVEMAIREDASAFIHADSLAKVSTDGLIGNPIVVLYEGTAGQPAVTDGAELAAGEAASVEDMMAMLQENNANLLAITDDLKGMTERIAAGEGTVGQLLGDDQLYADVRSTVDTLRDASVNAEVLTSNLSTFARQMNQPGSLPNQLVTDQETWASLTTTVDNLETVASSAARVVEGFEQGATDPDMPLGTLLGDREAGSDLKSTIENLDAGSALLNENLRALQQNFLFRRYFRRQERERAKAQEEQQEAAEQNARVREGDPPPAEADVGAGQGTPQG